MAKTTILERLRKIHFPVNDRGVANRLALTLDHANNIMRMARDKEYVTLEAGGLYWPTDKLKGVWRE